MEKMIYENKITLYNSYFNAHDKLSLKAILSIFQDVASIHAEEIGVGFSDMVKKGFYWVLIRIKIDVIKMPKPNETVLVSTWPLEKGRIDFDREFKICSLGGETLITGVSKWCVIDTTTRTLKRTDGVDYVGEYVDQKIYLEPFNKITLPNDMGKKQLTHVVNYSDLDHNWHMNNTNYANLISAVCKNKDFTHFEINFISECMENQEISVYSKEENGEFFVGKVGEKVSFTAYLK